MKHFSVLGGPYPMTPLIVGSSPKWRRLSLMPVGISWQHGPKRALKVKFPIIWRAKATASSVVANCKAVVKQYGVGTSTCPVTHDLAKASKNPEDRCHETCLDKCFV